MKRLRVLFLADEKPGHYHLSEGVIAALERLAELTVTRIEIRRRRLAPGRLLWRMTAANLSPKSILRFGYGLRENSLPAADLVLSAGGNTLAANIAARNDPGKTTWCQHNNHASRTRPVFVAGADWAV